MKFGHDDGKDLDLENLDSIIKRCEEAMGKSFKKKGEPEAVVEIEEPEDDEKEEGGMEGADLDDLLELYSKIKGK
jgi:hypothetical protein